MTVKSIKQADIYNRTLRNTRVEERCHAVLVIKMLCLPPIPPWLGRSVLCKCNMFWRFLTQLRLEQGEQGFLLSVKQQDDGALRHLVCRDCDIWCSSLWKLTGVWTSCFTSLASHMQAMHWKALQGKYRVLHNVHKEVKHSSVSSIRALERFQMLETIGHSSASPPSLHFPPSSRPRRQCYIVGNSQIQSGDPAPSLTWTDIVPPFARVLTAIKLGHQVQSMIFNLFTINNSFLFHPLTHSHGLFHANRKFLLAVICVWSIKGGKA